MSTPLWGFPTERAQAKARRSETGRRNITQHANSPGGAKITRRMAKKVAPAALQTEVLNDEEWAKVLKRKGLVVVDVYSDWSGPCTGMVSILKKIKMEIGGDALSYATASCNRVTDLKRFQGKSEPTWMFIHEGRMINLMFGAHCPQFVKMLMVELERIQKGDEHEFSIEVFEKSPEEVVRLKIQEEAKIAKETARKSRKVAEAKARYEAEMLHWTTSLCNETCLLLFPWIFKDEEGRRRDKRMSPPYVELIEELLPENYVVEQELRKRMNENLLQPMLDESTYSFSESSKQLLFDGKCMFMRLKIVEGRKNLDVHNHLCNILFNELTLPESEDYLNEECYAGKHCPAFEVPDKENKKFPFVWTPPNPRNKAVVFRTIFTVYSNTTYPLRSIRLYCEESRLRSIFGLCRDWTFSRERKSGEGYRRIEIIFSGYHCCRRISIGRRRKTRGINGRVSRRYDDNIIAITIQ